MFDEIRFASVELSNRCLDHASKWAIQLLINDNDESGQGLQFCSN